MMTSLSGQPIPQREYLLELIQAHLPPKADPATGEQLVRDVGRSLGLPADEVDALVAEVLARTTEPNTPPVALPEAALAQPALAQPALAEPALAQPAQIPQGQRHHSTQHKPTPHKPAPHTTIPTSLPLTSPTLLVDFGQPLRVGRQVAAQFHLFLPELGSTSSLEVRASLSRSLDQPDWKPRPLVRQRGPDHWCFTQEFSLTTAGQHCRPGQYSLSVLVRLPTHPAAHPHTSLPTSLPTSATAPQILGAQLRLSVDEGLSGKTLEVCGDGASLINLHTRELSEFRHVRITGGDQTAINLQGSLLDGSELISQKGNTQAAAQGDLFGADDRSNTQVAIALEEEQPEAWDEPTPDPQRLPSRLAASLSHCLQATPSSIDVELAADRRRETETACLTWPDGRRTLLLARPRVVFGRDRVSNDVVLRLLPRNSQRDRRSLRISGRHFQLEPQGVRLCLTDLRSPEKQAANPLRLDHQPAAAVQFLAGPRHLIQLAGAMRLEVDLFTTNGRLTAARLRRSGNPDGLDSQEEYLLIFAPVLIGCTEESAIAIPGAPPRAAQLQFVGGHWQLEALPDASRGALKVNGPDLWPGEQVTLIPETQIKIAGIDWQFGPFAQHHLEGS